MQDFLKAPKTKTLLYVLCAILIVLLAFGLGLAIGYRRALFASRYGENYYQNFYGGPGSGFMVMGAPGGPPSYNTHGVAGEVINVSSSTLSVKDYQGNEQSVMVVSGTPIREMNNTIFLSDIMPGDSVTVIGEPNNQGQVEARFIRVFEASSSPGQ